MTDFAVGDGELWRSVADTLARVVVPSLQPGAGLDAAVQMQGMARYAATRPQEGPGRRAVRLSRALRPHAVSSDLAAVLGEASRTLVAGLSAAPGSPLAERRLAVRGVLLEMLDEDIRAVAPLMETFSGHPAVAVLAQDRALPAEVDQLTSWFADRFAGPVRVTAASVISGGHSRRMLRVTVADPTGREQAFVVRIEQGGTFGTDGTREAMLMGSLRRAGVPVAPVRWIETSEQPLGHPFFVMDLVAGSSAVDSGVLDAFVQTLAALHQLDPAAVADALGTPPPSPEKAVLTQIEHWSGVYRSSVGIAVPLLDEAAEWLRLTLRPTGPVAVVHGDPGPGNFLAGDGRISAITDWEFGHYGDAAEDWAYLAIRGRKLKDSSLWYADFARLVGVKHDEPIWRAWEAFNSFKGACANLTALRLFRVGTATTPNLLAIGTAVHYRFLRRLADLVTAPAVPSPDRPTPARTT